MTAIAQVGAIASGLGDRRLRHSDVVSISVDSCSVNRATHKIIEANKEVSREEKSRAEKRREKKRREEKRRDTCIHVYTGKMVPEHVPVALGFECWRTSRIRMSTGILEVDPEDLPPIAHGKEDLVEGTCAAIATSMQLLSILPKLIPTLLLSLLHTII